MKIDPAAYLFTAMVAGLVVLESCLASSAHWKQKDDIQKLREQVSALQKQLTPELELPTP